MFSNLVNNNNNILKFESKEDQNNTGSLFANLTSNRNLFE